MPTSFLKNIPIIIQAIYDVNPASVLDIGIGRGKYGLLVREYLPSVKTIDGLEIYEPYITDIQRSIYDHIFVGNILETEIDKYDLYLLIDVIEHFEKEEGHKLISKLLEKGKVLISTPLVWMFKEDKENPWEEHKTLWTIEDFEKYNRNQYPCENSIILTL